MGPHAVLYSKDGALVNRQDGTWERLLINDIQTDEEYESYPIGGLPSDAVFVVRTSALEALISEPNPTTERPIGQRERDTLLVIIAALAEVQGIDVKRVSKAAIEIVATASKLQHEHRNLTKHRADCEGAAQGRRAHLSSGSDGPPTARTDESAAIWGSQFPSGDVQILNLRT